MSSTLPAWLPSLIAGTGRLAPALAARIAAELLTRPRGRNPPQPWELDPAHAPARSVTFASGLKAAAWGHTGPLVLALHGWRGRPSQFGPLAVALVARGLRVIAVDAPGHGGSPGVRVTPHLLAGAVAAIAAEAGSVHAVVGHSLGGAAAGIALERGLAGARLALIASPTRVSLMIAGLARELQLPPAARDTLDAWFDRHAGRPVAELDLVAVLPRTGARALVVHDELDDVIPVGEARLLAAACPGVRALYTRGLGHRDLLAAAEVIAAVTDFIVAGPSGGTPPQPGPASGAPSVGA